MNFFVLEERKEKDISVNTNGLNEVFEAGSWWIMPPMNYFGAFNQIFVVTDNHIVYTPQWANSKIRPVIFLNACAKIKSGNGNT